MRRYFEQNEMDMLSWDAAKVAASEGIHSPKWVNQKKEVSNR